MPAKDKPPRLCPPGFEPRPLKCGHGRKAALRPAPGYPAGWWEPIAEGCQLCGGGTCGIPFKISEASADTDARRTS